MYKYIPAFIIFDKAKPLFLIEPLYFAFCQIRTPPFPKIFPGGLHNRRRKKSHPFQERDLKRQWLDCFAGYEGPTFPYPAHLFIS